MNLKLARRGPRQFAGAVALVAAGVIGGWLIRDMGPAAALAVEAADPPPGPDTSPASVECRRADGPIQIDGRDDEEAWQIAQVVEDFSPYWLERPARTATRARLLWDDDALYFHAEMEDGDLYADVTEPDGMTWYNDVFESFKPSREQLGYYEFQVNAAGTPLDMYLPSRGAGGYGRFAKDRPFHMESAVGLRGTLGDWRDQDEGWSVEGKIPWTDFAPTGGPPGAGDRWRFALCRYDYSVTHESPDLSTSAPITRPDFHRYEDYAELEFVGK